MARKKPQQKSWRNLIRKPLADTEIHRIRYSSATMTDQTAALVFGALLERSLERAVLSRMTRLNADFKKQILNFPLNSFRAKIIIGHALALYGKETFIELDYIRQIRNAFAHAVHNIKFSTPIVASSCKKLKTSNKFIFKIFPDDIKIPPISPRDKYICATTILWLMLSAHELGPNRPIRLNDGFARRYLS